MADPLTHTTEYTYDQRGRVLTVEDALNGLTQYQYDPAGNLTSLTDPAGNETTFTYDDLNRLKTETNELAATRTRDYDDLGRLISVADRNGRVREFSYDQLSRISEERWLDGTTVVNTIAHTWDDAGQLQTVGDSESAYDFDYDSLGRITRVDNLGTPGVPNVVLTSTFDGFGNRTQLAATVGGTPDFVNEYLYDALNRMTRVTQAGGTGVSPVSEKRVDLSYNAAGQYDAIARYADLAGTQFVATTTHAYDGIGRLTGLTHAQGTTTFANYSWSYDAASRVTQMTGPDGTTTYNYDNTNQLTGADHSYQTDESYTYDANGNRTNGDYETDTNNRLTTDGAFDFTYDAEGNRTRRKEHGLLVVGSGAGISPTVKVYDGDNGALRSEFLAYDPAFTGGVFVAVGDVNGDGTPDIITGPGTGHDPRVKVFDGTDLTGGTVLYEFDAYNTAFQGGVFVAAADLTGDGRAEIITAAAAGGGPHVKVLDGADPEGTPLYSFFAYDTSMTAGVRIAVGDVNGDGTPDLITAPGKNVAPLVRVLDGTNPNPSNPLHEFHAFASGFTGGVFVAAGDVNGDGKADVIAGAGPGGGPAVRVFSGADASQLTQFYAYDLAMTGGVRVAAVDVDADGRADILTVPGGFPSHVKAFDGDDLTGATELYDFHAWDTSYTGGAFVGGNGANWVETLYTWDHRNRLTSVTEQDANGRAMKEVEYAYDVFDRRIAKRVDEGADGTFERTERYVYDGEDIALVFDGAGSLKNRYLHGPGIDEVFADENALGEILWGLGDNQGTIRDVAKYDAGTDTTSVVNHLKYDAFGKITSQSNAAYEPRFTYTGREWDADAGAYYYRTRWYGPDIGQFWSEDWIGFAAGDPNLRRYVFNSPTNYTDPSGLDVFVQNRQLNPDAKSIRMPVEHGISHTFVYTTNPDGSLKDTYSWGNEYTADESSHWYKNESEDRSAAREAILQRKAYEKASWYEALFLPDNFGQRVGNQKLEVWIAWEFERLRCLGEQSPSAHSWQPWKHCKHETDRLIQNAREAQRKATFDPNAPGPGRDPATPYVPPDVEKQFGF